MMTEFKLRFGQLTKKARVMFMEGNITFGQAHQFSTARHRFRKVQLNDLTRRHIDHHTEILNSLPFITYSIQSVDDLMHEISRLPRAIQHAIMSGQLTLVQARYARERSLGRKDIAALTSRNATDLITAPVTRPVRKAPRDLVPLRRPSSPRIPTRR